MMVETFSALRRERKILLFQSVFFLVIFQAVVIFFSLRTILSMFKLQLVTELAPEYEIEKWYVLDVHWAIQTVIAHLHFLPCKCFAQALAARYLLAKRKIPSQLFLGIQIQKNCSITAHAWLKVQNIVVTGVEGIERHKVIAVFQ